MTPRVVLDTNIIVSGFGCGGVPGHVLDAAFTSTISTVGSPPRSGSCAKASAAALATRGTEHLDGDVMRGGSALDGDRGQHARPPAGGGAAGGARRAACALRRADAGDPGELDEVIARAVLNNLYRFVVPAVAGPAKLVPLAALADEHISQPALRTAAKRGRLQAVRRSVFSAHAAWSRLGRVHLPVDRPCTSPGAPDVAVYRRPGRPRSIRTSRRVVIRTRPCAAPVGR